MSTENFIDENYESPSSGGSYTKLELGENRMRILSSPLLVWVIWADGKPSRIPYDRDKRPKLPTGENPSVKHAWIMTVFNYGTNSIEILELDKATIITPLLAHSRDQDWGHPKHYDIVIVKSGSGREGTKYSFVAKPQKPVTQEVMDAYFATPIDLDEMLKPDGNPFLTPPPAETAKETAPAIVAEKAPETVTETSTAPAAGTKKPPF